VAVAVSLRTAAGDMVTGGGHAALSALAKLDQLLPPILRRQVGALDAMTSRLGAATSPVDAELLVTLTRACRDGERLRATYHDGRGRESQRSIDPHRLVQTPRRWYLVAHDRDRDDWRTFRVDRLLDVTPTGHIVRLVDPPDPVAFVQRAITSAPYRHQARVELLAPIDDVRPLVPPTTGALDAIDATRTMLSTGADDLPVLVFHLVALGVDFVVHEPPELQAEVTAAARRLSTAAARR
jgi:predicted DNA-binding transcriptional regulator YafY